MLRHFRWPLAVTLAGLAACFWIGFASTGRLEIGLSYLFLGAVLSILEISLSFDNAIVNANKLQSMSAVWRRRFLTWGILIAVFGMRLVFPLVIVAVAAKLSPIGALSLAARDPVRYSEVLAASHTTIAAFGGTFLMMVALTYFIDAEKEVHWIAGVERGLSRCAAIRGVEISAVLVTIVLFTLAQADNRTLEFLFAAVAGLMTFLLVELLGQLLDRPAAGRLVTGGLGAFLYLEVLDASFSFDGVIGAFALTHNFFLIAIGLGIGAMYVRAMTIMLVEKQTLSQFRFLEHGAFWSILFLALIMFAQSLYHIPEIVTGLLGAGLIGVSLWSSVRYQTNSASE